MFYYAIFRLTSRSIYYDKDSKICCNIKEFDGLYGNSILNKNGNKWGGILLKEIPDFGINGRLPKGIYPCTGYQFLYRFCNTDYRENFKKCISDIFDFAMETEAAFLFFGGSFITKEAKPNDIDCVMVYQKNEQIPPRSERLLIGGTRLDIMFCSLENRELVDAYIALLSHSRYGGEVGVVQVILNSKDEVWDIQQYSAHIYDIVKEGYINRSFIDCYEPNGIIVTVHGLLSTAKWNCEIAPVVSSQGWVFAPYVYENNSLDLLVDATKREKVVDEFRNWIYELSVRFEASNISIIAHSFGTYIVTSYLSKFESPPVMINCLILTGSIIRNDFNWEAQRGKVGRVLNEIAPNDEWVRYMPTNATIKKITPLDALFGDSGVKGFSVDSKILTQSKNEIFNHNNVIRRDVIEQKWMPFLNANRYAIIEEVTALSRNR